MYTCILRISQFMSDFKMKPKPFNMLLAKNLFSDSDNSVWEKMVKLRKKLDPSQKIRTKCCM